MQFSIGQMQPDFHFGVRIKLAIKVCAQHVSNNEASHGRSSFALPVKQVFETCSRAIQPRHHRSKRDTRCRCNLFVRELLELAQNNDRTVLRRKGFNTAPQGIEIFVQQQHTLRAFAAGLFKSITSSGDIDCALFARSQLKQALRTIPSSHARPSVPSKLSK